MEVVYQPIEVEKKETAILQKIEPKVEPPESMSRQQEDAGVEGVCDESLAGMSTKRDPVRKRQMHLLKNQKQTRKSNLPMNQKIS